VASRLLDCRSPESSSRGPGYSLAKPWARGASRAVDPKIAGEEERPVQSPIKCGDDEREESDRSEPGLTMRHLGSGEDIVRIEVIAILELGLGAEISSPRCSPRSIPVTRRDRRFSRKYRGVG
jgi:hypothetical protein